MWSSDYQDGDVHPAMAIDIEDRGAGSPYSEGGHVVTSKHGSWGPPLRDDAPAVAILTSGGDAPGECTRARVYECVCVCVCHSHVWW
jgi:hypothetical protein